MTSSVRPTGQHVTLSPPFRYENFLPWLLPPNSNQLATMWGWEMLYANIQDGFLEAIVRGHRAGLLTVPDYNNLCQCENLEDIKLNLVGSPSTTMHASCRCMGFKY